MSDTFNEELIGVEFDKAYEELVDNIIEPSEKKGSPKNKDLVVSEVRKYRQANELTLDDLDEILKKATRSEDFKKIKNRIGLHRQGLPGQKPTVSEENIFYGLKNIREYIDERQKSHTLLPKK